MVDGWYISHRFAEVFNQALADSTLTAWVCCNDTLGLEALRFLRSRRVRVPLDISVVGFDNSDRALLAGLTSYSFVSPTAMRRVLQSVIAPNAVIARESLVSPVELDGVVKPRGSSQAAPRAGNALPRRGRGVNTTKDAKTTKKP
jgi:LacI family transcriptional regulator